MSNINSFKDLTAWQKSISLAKLVYKITENFPKEETYGLTSQMRRAAVSIPSNIAEGSKRAGEKDYSQFLRIASGSASELETQIVIAKDLYVNIDFTEAENLLLEIQKMLSTMISKLK